MAKVHVFSRSSKCDSRIKHKQGKQARASNHKLAARQQLTGTELPSHGLGARVPFACVAIGGAKAHRPTPTGREKQKLCTACHHRHGRRWWPRFAPRLSAATTRRSPLLVIPLGVRRFRIVLLLRRGGCRGGPPCFGGPRRSSGTRTGSSTRMPGRLPGSGRRG